MEGNHTIDAKLIKDIPTLMKKVKWLKGKTLLMISEEIKKTDESSRVTTKGNVGHFIEEGFFGIKKNTENKPDIEHLRVEIKTCPLKYNQARNRLSVKEPLSLNMINYHKEAKCNDITDSSLYKKNQIILFIFYIHDKKKERSEYPIELTFLWKMNKEVLDELRPDYDIILNKIKQGNAHHLHQGDNKYLTTCPKHNGKFKDPNCKISKEANLFVMNLQKREHLDLKIGI